MVFVSGDVVLTAEFSHKLDRGLDSSFGDGKVRPTFVLDPDTLAVYREIPGVISSILFVDILMDFVVTDSIVGGSNAFGILKGYIGGFKLADDPVKYDFTDCLPTTSNLEVVFVSPDPFGGHFCLYSSN